MFALKSRSPIHRNISWGHATSRNLIDWEDVGGWQDTEPTALAPGRLGTYNGLGVWTGTGQPVNLHGKSDGTLSVIYTSISELPVEEDRQNHSETWSIATSKDAGKTWQNYPGNPVVFAPEDWNLTGWRDPFFFPLPDLDDLLLKKEPHYYAVMSGGIKGVGPRMPLYSAPQSDLTNWTFLGALWEPEEDSSLGSYEETGSYGYGWECGGFFTLHDSEGKVHWYVNMGADDSRRSVGHWTLWNEGDVKPRTNGSVEFIPMSGGALDWGLGYAATSFIDAKNNGRRVMWTWVPEAMEFTVQQGFQGAFALPQELFVHEMPGVSETTSGRDSTISYEGSDGNSTTYTLGIKPLPEVVDAIRGSSSYKSYGNGWFDHSKQGSSHMSLTVTLSHVSGGAAGVYIAQSPNGKESTTIYYCPENNTIEVDRSKSSLLKPHVSSEPTFGFFKPYELTSGDEDITLNIFLDGSLLEVYANDRFAMSTRIYPARNDSTRFGLYLEKGARAKFSNFSSWIDLRGVWPKRPTNSSSSLIFDTVSETGNYTWWSGN